ncbi:hypothetical protein A3Q37_06531 [Streptomyces sp. PTY087I2]|nr:hypothetical protein A3Q37_06531 [Streptomyces sp. PTY087I2]
MISSERDLKSSNATFPAPLNFPSNGSAAAINCWINVPRSVLAPCESDNNLDRTDAPISNFTTSPVPPNSTEHIAYVERTYAYASVYQPRHRYCNLQSARLRPTKNYVPFRCRTSLSKSCHPDRSEGSPGNG